ncbi:WD-40 repeat protein [Richelia intracellularis]|nr:WD-40 repeat protein [Richelia intracellularis]
MWETQRGKEIYTLKGHNDDIFAVAFSPNGKTLASGSYDKTIKFWQVDTGREFNTFAENHGAIYCLAFSPDGKIMASGNGNKTILLLPFEQN